MDIQTISEYWNIVYEFFEAFTDFSIENRIIL